MMIKESVMCSQRGSTCNYKAIKEQNLNKEFILKQIENFRLCSR